MTQSETADMIGDKKEDLLRVTHQHGALKVHVFGSRARKEGGPKSDLDLLVKMKRGSSLLDIIAIKQDLEDLLGIAVDVVTEQALSPYLREKVLQEAIPLEG
jgi:uncharacterized protein